MDKKYVLTGKTFGKWTVLYRAPSNKFQDAYWWCRCSCAKGTEKAVKGSFLRRGMSTNCGCERARKLGAQTRLPSGESAARQLLNTYSQMARWKDRPFELTLEQFKTLTKGDCYYCGIPPCQFLQKKWRGKNQGDPYQYNGVDRLDSSKGYTLENCVSSCGVHNKMKLDMSEENFYQACLAVVKYYGKKRDSRNLAPAAKCR